MNSFVSTVFYGLAASLFWGSGDFSGGLASRRARATSVVLAGYAVGFVFLAALAIVFREPFPHPSDFLWGALSGLTGVAGLVAFYTALASGKMGIAAPLAALLTAGLPVLFSIFTNGLPAPLQLGGFALALVAIILIARPERGGLAGGASRAIGLALVAGFGFGLFFIFISRVSPATTFGSLAIARFTSVASLFALQVIRRRPLNPGMAVAPLVALAGGLDALGNVFFLLAAHSGRLDIAAIVSSLYPAATVLLAALILRERVQRAQAVGILLALVAIPLISV
ncbi:MAG TPA: DMT family transporter [Ktedonobacterales bacterium]